MPPLRQQMEGDELPREIPISKIVDAAITGIADAQEQYEAWTGGQWLWQAPEYLITTTIAATISALDGKKFLTLENGATDAIVDAGAKGRGILHGDIRERGRVDLLLWWGKANPDSTPRAVIEVKNQFWRHGQYCDDISRIREFLNRNAAKSSLQFGLFAFYDSARDGVRKGAVAKISGKLDRVHRKCETILGGGFDVSLHHSKIRRSDSNAWAAACILVKRKS